MRVNDMRPWVAADVIRPGRLGDWEPGEWVTGAVCAQTDPEVFYPEKGQTSDTAKAVCRVCPVREQCLAYAVVTDDRHGVWGGMTRKERDRLTVLAVPGMPEVVVKLGKRADGPRTAALDAKVAALTAAGKSAAEIGQEVGRSARNVVRARNRRKAAEAQPGEAA